MNSSSNTLFFLSGAFLFSLQDFMFVFFLSKLLCTGKNCFVGKTKKCRACHKALGAVNKNFGEVQGRKPSGLMVRKSVGEKKFNREEKMVQLYLCHDEEVFQNGFKKVGYTNKPKMFFQPDQNRNAIGSR